jgi:hypothetical protein
MMDIFALLGAYVLGFVFGACLTALMRGNDGRPCEE